MKLKQQFKNIFSRKPELHFIHVRKTGGSAIKTALEGHEYDGKFKIIMHRHDTELADIPRGEKVLFVLREPVSRFISGFYSRQRKGAPRYHREWTEGEEKAFSLFKTPNDLAKALNENHPNHLQALEAMEAIKHISHFSDWFGSLEYLESRLDDVLFIGFQESLDNDFETIKDLLGLSHGISLPSDDVGAHRNPATVDKNLEQDSRALLEQWFFEDIAFYKRCLELKNSI